MTQRIGVAPSAARTTDYTSPVFVSKDGEKALHLVVDLTAGTPNIVVAIKGKDLTSNKAYTILQSAALNATGTTVLKVGPGLTAATGLVANDVMPHDWFVAVTASGVSGTYSIGASLI